MLLGILNSQAAGAAKYFIGYFGGSGQEFGNSIEIDSSENIYVVGDTTSDGAGQEDIYLTKFDGSLVNSYTKSLGISSGDRGRVVRLDSNDNTYIQGTTYVSGEQSLVLAKHNSSGTIQWQRTLSDSDTITSNESNSLVVDSSDNIVMCSYYNDATTGRDAFLAKYNSSGTLQWQRTLSSAALDEAFVVITDASNNIYLGGVSDEDAFLAKYNSSGTLQWQRTLSDGYAKGLALDSLGNIYLAGRGASTAILAKYNSSGTLQWQVGLSASTFQDVKILDDVIYVSQNRLIASYNTSGTLLFQRSLTSGNTDFAYKIALTEDSIVCIGSVTSFGVGARSAIVARLPLDGSLAGSYALDGATIVYAAGTQTTSVTTATSATSTLTSSASSATDSAGALTSSSITFTQETVSIG